MPFITSLPPQWAWCEKSMPQKPLLLFKLSDVIAMIGYSEFGGDLVRVVSPTTSLVHSGQGASDSTISPSSRECVGLGKVLLLDPAQAARSSTARCFESLLRRHGRRGRIRINIATRGRTARGRDLAPLRSGCLASEAHRNGPRLAAFVPLGTETPSPHPFSLGRRLGILLLSTRGQHFFIRLLLDQVGRGALQLRSDCLSQHL